MIARLSAASIGLEERLLEVQRSALEPLCDDEALCLREAIALREQPA